MTYNLNFLGTPGVIEMPSGMSTPDGELTTTVSHFAGITRTALSFQITDRISGSFRFSATEDWPNSGVNTYYDRSFDLRFRVLDETRYRPAVTVGFQDFAGTGLSSAEYIAATKHIGQRLRLTAGFGWGRLATYKSFSNPFGLDDRPTDFTPTGGEVNADRFFRGPVSPFAGIEWQVNDRLRLMAEYSSDGYLEEVSRGILDRSSPINIGLSYRIRPNIDLGAYYLYGSEFGVRASFALNPKSPPAGTGSESAPLPVLVRAEGRQAALSWPETSGPSDAVTGQLAAATSTTFEAQGLVLESLRIEGRRATVRFRNPTYNVTPQAMGRAARLLTYTMPPGVEEFRLIPVVDGVPLSAVTIRRSDLEAQEHAPNGTAALQSAMLLEDAFGTGPAGHYADGLYPNFSWQLSPYLASRLFGLDDPFLADVGLEFSARYDISPGLSVSGSVRKRVLGNLDTPQRVFPSGLPRVRSDAQFYDQQGDPSIERLTADYLFRPGRDLYGRVSAGYLEEMFGGVSAEVLWKPVSSRLALGAELNFVRQRDFDQLFGFRDYDVWTGHASAYYAFGNGFHGQLDVGRYLAGDVGATLSLNREFENGWEVGAFATLTDASSAEFGAGSFDKGIRVVIPLSSFTGQPSRVENQILLRPFQRDGGARLEVENRLYDTVRDYHDPKVADSWGRVLR